MDIKLNAKGVKPSIQIPIEIGYRITRMFANKSPEAKQNSELLGLMVNDPNVDPAELLRIKCPTLVIAGNKDMIKDKHTRLIAERIHINGASALIHSQINGVHYD